MIAEASAIAYKGAPHDIQQKLRRVVEVWGQRSIWEPNTQDAVVAKIDGKQVLYPNICSQKPDTCGYIELDKNKSTSRKPILGGSLFSSSSAVPPELEPIIPLQEALSDREINSATAVSTADIEYEKLISSPAPTPPVHAARLSSLLKNLASAENAVSESIKARRALLEELEKLTSIHRGKIMADEVQLVQVSSRKATIDTKKREVEDGIMRGLATEDGGGGSSPMEASPGTPGMNNNNNMNGNGISSHLDPERPQMEELTPPPVESLTPVGSPQPQPALDATSQDAHPIPEQQPPPNQPYNHQDPTVYPPYIPYGSTSQASPPSSSSSPPQPPLGSDILSSLRMPPTTNQVPLTRDPRLRSVVDNNGVPAGSNSISSSSSSPQQQHPTKKRKIAEDEFEGFGGGGDPMADLDDDVAALLRAESGGGGGGS